MVQKHIIVPCNIFCSVLVLESEFSKASCAGNLVHMKNMVCNRCIRAVQEVFENNGAFIISIKLGEVEISNELEEILMCPLKEDLETIGFTIIDNRRA